MNRRTYFYNTYTIRIPGAPNRTSDLFWERLYRNAHFMLHTEVSVVYIKGFQGGIK